MSAEHDLAPVLRYDAREPFPVQIVAPSVMGPDGQSPSSSMRVPDCDLPGHVTVEYALWSDVEIGHAYELEHVWVRGVRTGSGWEPVHVYASAHGVLRDLGASVDADGRPVVFVEPGKHGHAGSADGFVCSPELLTVLCTGAAGSQGVHRNPLTVGARTVDRYRAAWRLLRSYAFEPSFTFTRLVDVRHVMWMLWADVARLIPERVSEVLANVSSDPLGLRVGMPGDAGVSAWAARVVPDGDGWFVDGVALPELVRAAERERRMLLLAVPDSAMLSDLNVAIWLAWGSAFTLMLSPDPVDEIGSVSPVGEFAGSGWRISLDGGHGPLGLWVGPGGDLVVEPDEVYRLVK